MKILLAYNQVPPDDLRFYSFDCHPSEPLFALLEHLNGRTVNVDDHEPGAIKLVDALSPALEYCSDTEHDLKCLIYNRAVKSDKPTAEAYDRVFVFSFFL